VTVLLGARNKAAGEKAADTLATEGIDARFLAIDVADYASIEAAAAAITTSFGCLDILVNNAGINDPSDGQVFTARLDAVERVLRTNFLGALAVTQAMLPLLRKSKAARVVNVSSGLGSLTQIGDPSFSRPDAVDVLYPTPNNMLTLVTCYPFDFIGPAPKRFIVSARRLPD
jgi:NAD(P)-dependent dehydrogenase (short-subunit alcohol dehydrogenase family)